MKKIEVKIKEKDKGIRDLSLLNLRDEVVNFLYKDTVANSTKADLQFFVLLYFISIRIGNETFLEKILDEGIPKFNKLNESFARKKSYLRATEYRKMVEDHGLSDLFENDIFFVLVEAILNIKEIKQRYEAFLKKNSEVNRVIEAMGIKYAPQFRTSFAEFKSSKIKDDRYDEYGNYHDLSKSVYRTVRMRNSRNLDLNLQKYTSVKEITSKSPIDLTFLQHIDSQIIFDLWDKYHVAGYMKSIWRIANDSPIISGSISGIFGGLVVKFSEWKLIDGKRNRTEKDKAKQEFDKLKNENGKLLDELTLRLVDSVLKANERLEKEVDDTRTKIRELSGKGIVMQDKELIKKLEMRVGQLENLSVSAKVVDDLK
jgi:hypothetical protein